MRAMTSQAVRIPDLKIPPCLSFFGHFAILPIRLNYVSCKAVTGSACVVTQTAASPCSPLRASSRRECCHDRKYPDRSLRQTRLD